MKTQTIIFDPIAPHPEPVPIASLLNDIEATIKKHVIFSDHSAAALAVWVLHTWTFELRDIVAYVAIESPEKRCGKTTLLSVLAAMANKSLIASNVTVGALFRAIDTCRPTLFIDEADTFLAGNGTMRGIINSGNTWRTAYVLRLTKSKPVGQAFPATHSLSQRERVGVRESCSDKEYVTLNNEGASSQLNQSTLQNDKPSDDNSPSLGGEGRGLPRRSQAEAGEGELSKHTTNFPVPAFPQPDTGLKKYSCWCPKVIAMIGQVPDTIADRSIVVSMSRKLVTEPCAPLAELDATDIKAKCARFALDNRDAIAQSPKIRGEGLNDRAADTFDPLYVIARLAGAGWEQKLHTAALALNAATQADNSGTELLLDIISIFMLSDRERILIRDLAYTLREGGCGMKSFALKYQNFNEYRISQILRSYGVKTMPVRDRKEVGRGYAVTQFHEAIRRYVPCADFQARVDELRERGKLQAEARAEAAKETALVHQIVGAAPQDRHLSAAEIVAMVREQQAHGGEKNNDNVTNCNTM